MGEGCSSGQMAGYMKASTSRIKNKGLVESHGLMARSTRVSGIMACSTERASTKAKMGYGEKAAGSLESV